MTSEATTPVGERGLAAAMYGVLYEMFREGPVDVAFAGNPKAIKSLKERTFAILDAYEDRLVSAPAVVGEVLEPCPHCGSPAEFVRDEDEDGSFVAIQCTGCGCGSGKHYPIMDSADSHAAGEWNRRPTPSPAIPDREEIVGVLRSLADAYECLCGQAGMNYHESPSSHYARARSLLAKLEVKSCK